jgi:hypothetical protein
VAVVYCTTASAAEPVILFEKAVSITRLLAPFQIYGLEKVCVLFMPVAGEKLLAATTFVNPV